MRTHDRQVGWICAFENAAGIDAYLTICVDDAGAVTDEAAIECIVPELVNAGQAVFGCERNDALAA